jgi:site-specific DNA-methyltransferase (adenine-specific)
VSNAVALAANQIHQGDCIEKLAEIEAGTVDLVFADPPFNIGYRYDVYDDKQSHEDYLRFCRDWIGGVHRATHPRGSFWLAIGDEYAAELKLLSQEIGFHCRSWVIWYYTFGVNCVRGFSRSHTHLFHFVKDPERFTFNGDNPAVRVPSARQLVYADARANTKGRLPDNTWILRPQDAPAMGFSPSHDTWYFSRVAGTFKEREGFHGCQMPEQLLGRIIRISSNPGDLVFDPFGGSGTTLVVAKKLGRRFMGVELSEDYAERIRQRLETCRVGDALDGPADPVRSAPATAKGKKRTEFRGGRPVIPLTAEVRQSIQAAFDDVAAVPSPKKNRRRHALDVLLDPEINRQFAAACKQEKLLGDARTWNEHLMELSRKDLLKREGAAAKASLKTIQPSIDAAEIAFQMVSVDYGLDLEALLSTPQAAEEFDSIAAMFGRSDASPREHRWAIWQLSKLAGGKKLTKAAMKIADEFLRAEDPPRRAFQQVVEAPDEIPRAGVYALWDPASVLFVGQSDDLPGALERVHTAEGWQKFDVGEVQWWPLTSCKEALLWRCLLVTRHKPWLNASFLHQPIATTLF